MKTSFTLLTAFLSFAFLTSNLTEAHANPPRSTFNPEVVESTIRELYVIAADQRRLVDEGRTAELTADDLAIICDGLGEQVAAQSANSFNDITMHLLADWRQHSEHRQVIEAILLATKNHAAQELREQRERPRPFDPGLSASERAGIIGMEALDQALGAFTLVYTFEFGRGLWRTRGAGLSRLDAFKNSLRTASEAALRRRGVIASTATIATVARVAQLQLETRKLDPIEELRETRQNRVRDLGSRIVAQRERLRSGRASREEIQTIGRELQGFLPEIRALLRSAPELTRSLEPVAEDLSEALHELETRGYHSDEAEAEHFIP